MIALGFAAFVLFGVLLVLPGASQHDLAAALQLDLTRSGLLASALLLGLSLGVLAAGPLVDRLPRRPILVLSTAGCGLCLLTVDAEMGFPRALVHLALAGACGGIYEIVLNAVAVDRWRAAAARRIALLHAGASFGAVLAPPVVGWLVDRGGFPLAFRALGAALLLLALGCAAVALPGPLHLETGRGPSPLRSLLRLPLLALGAVGFAYVGVEAGVTIFAVPWASDGLGLDPERGRTAISAFWLGLLLGRLVLAGAAAPDARVIVGAGLAGAVLLSVSLRLGLSEVELVVGALGCVLGSVFPLMVALAGRAHPEAAGAATGLVVGIASLGGFAAPWLAGVVGDAAGVAMAMASFSLWCLVIAAAAALAHARR